MTPLRWFGAASLIAALVTGAASATLGAQELRGVVRDSTSGLLIPGAVVSLLDTTGRALARTLTNQRGEFRTVLSSDVRQIRIVRLGFRPRDLRVSGERQGLTSVVVTMVPIPTFIQPVHVAADASCPRRRDRLAALGLLEQARAGLLATVVARSESPAEMTRLLIKRTVDGPAGRIVRNEVRIDSAALSTGSFVAARGAIDFVRQGFQADSAGSAVYFAPDAEVLLDDAFASGYCFHIIDPVETRGNQVGLGFRAANRRPGRVDVDGALWIDTVARTLVDIQYQYIGLDPQTVRFRPGGHIAFKEMGNGVVLIDRWFIRYVTPRLDSAARPSPPVVAAATGMGRRAPDLVLVAVEGGGELARAAWPDGHDWQASLGTLRLRLVTSAGRPAAGAVVHLADTDYQATADSAGNIQIRDLAPGPYSARVADERLLPLGITVPTPFRFAAARDSTVSSTVQVPSAADHTAERCARRDNHAPAGTAWLIGRVVTPDGEPVTSARWTLRWLSSGTAILKDATVGSDGVFTLCDLNRGDQVTLAVEAPRMSGVVQTLALIDGVTIVRVELKPR